MQVVEVRVVRELVMGEREIERETVAGSGAATAIVGDYLATTTCTRRVVS
jgi:hypothetical protein